VQELVVVKVDTTKASSDGAVPASYRTLKEAELILVEIVDRCSSGAPRYQYADFCDAGQLISWTPRIRFATQFSSVEEAEEVAELYRAYLNDPAVQIRVLE
jgi:hypothetical protein